MLSSTDSLAEGILIVQTMTGDTHTSLGGPTATDAAVLETRDYVRRIHWWVRLVGVIWLATLSLSLLAFGAFWVAMAVHDSGSDSSILRTTPSFVPSGEVGTIPPGRYATRNDCMQAPYTSVEDCNRLFPLD